ncbi:hypothetical protein BJ684DRAFT_14984 [Piptocephalis cylindrospora]|uniref:Endonuclease/exonuclease/phosphatase n=1 Tax=Piptocephalis cylindrospora TaxID=1907219 RepID=A0A4P9Y799_9FUNG|nr:hypothetical protein BJ684DRAFT_14984 [Piptocephalis cylindrospora]|eukprot:RKP14692.1 hypothetical protein BJ684DRAFT_14984 [Piptocephalis cylindrospora]
MDPSIACLQEVDNLNSWMALFRELQYVYLYCQHPLKQHGCCIIYKKNLFDLSGYTEVDLDEEGSLEGSDSPPASGFTKTMAQVIALRWKERPEQGLVISNHHLFWPPLAAYEKLRQTCVILEKCVSIGSLRQWPILMCGDSAVYSSMTGSPVGEDGRKELDIIPKYYFPQEGEDREALMDEEDKKKLKLISPQALLDRMASLPRATSAYGRYVEMDPAASNDWSVSGEPRWTNYTEWKGTLDYIFQVENENAKSLVLESVLQLPTEDIMRPGLPNDQWGSDHLCLMARYAMDDENGQRGGEEDVNGV